MRHDNRSPAGTGNQFSVLGSNEMQPLKAKKAVKRQMSIYARVLPGATGDCGDEVGLGIGAEEKGSSVGPLKAVVILLHSELMLSLSPSTSGTAREKSKDSEVHPLKQRPSFLSKRIQNVHL